MQKIRCTTHCYGQFRKLTILVFIVIYKIKFGRRACLRGTNPEAAKFSGIRELSIRLGIYILAGVLAAISAVINNSWLMTARADAGTGMEMQAITVAVLGGISVAGGSGHQGGVLLGVIIITMMKNITARISMAKRAIIMIMTTFMAITTIMNTAIWRMSWRSLTALP